MCEVSTQGCHASLLYNADEAPPAAAILCTALAGTDCPHDQEQIKCV